MYDFPAMVEWVCAATGYDQVMIVEATHGFVLTSLSSHRSPSLVTLKGTVQLSSRYRKASDPISARDYRVSSRLLLLCTLDL
jgi:hypothetical protein